MKNLGNLRDTLFGLLLAGSIAGVGNFLQWVTKTFTIERITDKVLIIAFVFLGAATVPALVNGVRFGGFTRADRTKPVFLIGSGIAGVLAAGYFIAIVGLNLNPGIGAGLTEIIDSGLSPLFYLVLVASMGVVGFSRMSLVGSGLIGAAMVMLLFKQHGGSLVQVSSDMSLPISLLMGLSALGALGTALSIWLFRKLVREHGVSIGGVLLFRYGIPAACFLLLWVYLGGSSAVENRLYPALLLSFVAGAVLISLILLAPFKFTVKLSRRPLLP